MGIARILFVADTHLGFDLPFRPRIQRRRRGPDFFANFERALAPARNGEVDCVVHGGDLLYRSKVPAKLVEMAFEPLKRVADNGIPVYLVPGNHERSAIPHHYLAEHPLIHIFDHPQTFVFQKESFRLALAGFPFVRVGVRKAFLDLLEQSGWRHIEANGHILCIHQAVDGARVGPKDYMFRHSHDIIKASELPSGFTAILAGHIHRFQALTQDLMGRHLGSPVFYPGSIDRTSFAERYEKKGYLTLEFETEGPAVGILKQWKFHKLPARPMIQLELNVVGMSSTQIKSLIQIRLHELPQDSVVKLNVYGKISESAMAVLRAPSLRALAPSTMNISATMVDYNYYTHRRKKMSAALN
jgi:exonuclease SbcD